MIVRFIVFAMSFLWVGRGYCQDKIETDRPDQTETPFLVPRFDFQGEFGFNKENHKNKDYVWVHPTSLLKYGISKRVELRFEASVITEHQQIIPQPKETTSLQPIELGTKIRMVEEKAWIPKTSFIAHVGVPFLAGKKARTTHAAPSFRFTMQNTISEFAALGYNIGAEWDGESSIPTWLYTFAPGFDIGEKWYAYIEAFGFVTKGTSPDHNIDAGLAYFTSNDTKIDISGGVGLSENSLKNYVALGFSFRVHTNKNKH